VALGLGNDRIGVRVGTRIGDTSFVSDTEIAMDVPLVPGADYAIVFDGSGLRVLSAVEQLPGADSGELLGGFHFAPGGNATGRTGGDDVPAINPNSIWDIAFRPICPDPRAMACVTLDAGRPFWCDIYLLGTDTLRHGYSQHGDFIADGNDTPLRADDGVYDNLNWHTAREVLGTLGKQLLTPEEFFAAALGVTEGTSAGKDPKRTGLDAPRTSRWGVMQATGNMSTWGLDGDPDGSRLTYRFGGYWGGGEFAGSRYAYVGHWPGSSLDWLSARGRSDHLQPV
jgi:hypothetical protein